MIFGDTLDVMLKRFSQDLQLWNSMTTAKKSSFSAVQSINVSTSRLSSASAIVRRIPHSYPLV